MSTRSNMPETITREMVEAVRASSDWLNDLRDEEIEHICRAALEASHHAELYAAALCALDYLTTKDRSQGQLDTIIEALRAVVAKERGEA